MDGTVAQPERAAGALYVIDDARLVRGWQPRRRDVDRFLEERTFERIGLVEDGKDLQLTGGQRALDGEFAPVDVLLDEDPIVESGPGGAHLRTAQERADAIEGLDEFPRVVRTNHASAAGESDRLEHQRER